jgi:hypothetical protein
MVTITAVPILNKIAISWGRPHNDGLASSDGRAVALSWQQHHNACTAALLGGGFPAPTLQRCQGVCDGKPFGPAEMFQFFCQQLSS